MRYNFQSVITKRNWQGAARRLRSALRPAAARERRQATLDHYVRSAPGPATAIDIFKGQWTSQLPPPYETLTGGTTPLHDDGRVQHALEVMGGVQGKRVLELGPLEAGHTYLLDRAGAADILAIEGNSQAFLRCLVVKELLGIPSARFVCGDFMEYLRGAPERVDFAMASGVLYHMMSPVELIVRLGAIADSVYLWTHYYDEARLASNARGRRRVVRPENAEYDGFQHQRYPFTYGIDLELDGFCGGNGPQARWLTRDTILAALAHAGFTRIHPYHDEPEHPHGPAFSVVAQR